MFKAVSLESLLPGLICLQEFLKCRPDIADHLFAKAPLANRLGNRDLVIETCYNAGIGALVTDPNVATMWLQRAVEQVELSIAKNETTSGDIGIWNIRCRATLGTSPIIGLSA